MYYSDKYFQTLKEDYLKLEKTLTKELKSLPKGKLVGRGKYFLWVYENDGKRIRKGITKNEKKIYELARKEYIEKALIRIHHNKSTLEEMAPAPILGNIVSEMQGVYERLDTKYFAEKNSEEWAEADFDSNPYYKEERTQVTGFGLHVRSKSECIIAEELYRRKYQFRYEAPLSIEGKNFYPDFTIKLPNGNIVYWEHCGLVADSDYMLKHDRKMERYREIGVAPWRNLIVTYDDEKGNIDGRKIKAMIEGWL